MKWVACQSAETVEGMPQVANTIAFRLGPFACLQRGTEGRLPPSTEKAIPSVPSMFDHHPTPAAPGDRRDRSDRSHRHVKGVRTTGRLIRKAPCPVKGEGGEGGAEGGRGREREREGQGRTHWGRRGWGEAVGGGGGTSLRNSAHGQGHEEGGLAHAKA